MLKYILNGQHIEVIPEHMEIFEAQNPTAKLMDEAYLAEKMGSEKMAKDILPTLTLKTPEIELILKENTINIWDNLIFYLN